MSNPATRLHAILLRSQDTLAKTVQCWKHLRPYWKRRQQRRERVAAAKLIRAEWNEQLKRTEINRGCRGLPAFAESYDVAGADRFAAEDSRRYSLTHANVHGCR